MEQPRLFALSAGQAGRRGACGRTRRRDRRRAKRGLCRYAEGRFGSIALNWSLACWARFNRLRSMTMSEDKRTPVRRRDLLALIGAASGGATMYQAMTTLGFAAESPYAGPIRLEGDPKGASVIVLGAGLAGLVAAIEFKRAGYRVQLLESEARAGGRCWTIRSGDRITDIDGASQTCGFDSGQYFNPGPWRIPHHHKAILDYCKRFGVALEPFIQVNHSAYVHARGAFGGRPQRFHHVAADFNGYVAELLAKAANQNRLDDAVTVEDRQRLLEAL